MNNLRLIAGTINYWPDDANWRNVTLDISPRGVYDESIQGFVSPDIVGDLCSGLPDIRDQLFDEIICHHVFEHMSLERAKAAAKTCHRILKYGGVLDIEVPDLDRVCEAWVSGSHDKDALQQWIFGEQLAIHEHADSHRYGFWPERLTEILGRAGFRVGERLDAEDGLAVRYRASKMKQ